VAGASGELLRSTGDPAWVVLPTAGRCPGARAPRSRLAAVVEGRTSRVPIEPPPDVPGRRAHGRAAVQELAWAEAFTQLSAAPMAEMTADDMEQLATAAYLVGGLEECWQALQRAHQAYLDDGAVRPAARCLFWLGFTLFLQGEFAQAGGWLARAGRLLEEESECGELLSLAIHFQGRDLVRQGRIREGLSLLDESMVAVVAGELAPYVAGHLYCSMVDACQEVFELRRAHEWTAALNRWCDQQPSMVTFSGQCLVHRAEIMQLRGQWPEAIEEAERACQLLAHAADRYASGGAWYRRAEIHRVRGEDALAEEGYQRASEWGHDPQPGLALLRLAAGRVDAARRAIDRAVAETTDRLRRGKLLPAQAEIALAAGDPRAARAAADELLEIAGVCDTPVMRASADDARGAVLLAGGDARGALPALRAAWRVWHELDAPYEAARLRVRIGLACRAMGDEDAAELELASARRAFGQLGAAPDLDRLDRSAGHDRPARPEPTGAAGAAFGRDRQDQPRDRPGASTGGEDRRPSRRQHPHQTGGAVPYRRHGVRLPERSGRGHLRLAGHHGRPRRTYGRPRPVTPPQLSAS
jgi:tetratricopeptide (TPR) repeat protein